MRSSLSVKFLLVPGVLVLTSSIALAQVPPNTPPIAVTDADWTNEDTAVTTLVLANDTDLDGDPLFISGNTGAVNGSVSCTTTACTYTPNKNFSGTDLYTYTAADGKGGFSNAAVSVIVVAMNDPPFAVDDFETTFQGVPVTVNVLANDKDDDGDLLTIKTWTVPSNGSASCSVGVCTYVPNSTFVGDDFFFYTIEDPAGATDVGKVKIRVSKASAVSTDLVIDKRDLQDFVAPGSTVTYVLAVRNAGGMTASSVQVIDQLPAGTTILNVSASGWECSSSVAELKCRRASLAAETESIIKLDVRVPESPGVVVNRAQVVSLTPDFNAQNNSDSEKTTVVDSTEEPGDPTDPVDPPDPPICPAEYRPVIAAVPETQSDVPMRIEVVNPLGAVAGGYEFQLSSRAEFSGAESKLTTERSAVFVRSVSRRTLHFARARALACNPTAFSSPVEVVYIPIPLVKLADPQLVAQHGMAAAPIAFNLFIPGGGAAGKTALDNNLTISTDKSYLTVIPSSVTVPPGGTTVRGTVNPQGLPPGTTTGTVTIRNTGSGSTVSSFPVSLTLTTPVAPVPKDVTPANALVVPVVAYTDGVRARFRSDLRIANTAPEAMTYQLTLTPSDADGTLEGKQTILTVQSGQTVAFDNVAEKQFGIGSLGESGSGVLEIRPVDPATSSPLNQFGTTIASTRTYNETPGGTYGQFVPAIPFSDAIGRSDSESNVMTLQRIAHNARYRTNIGFVEGSGETATVAVRLFNLIGEKLDEFTVDVPPSGHRQLNGILAMRNHTVDEGRMEVEVVSSSGKILAYASVVENTTGDGLFVRGINPATEAGSRFFVPAAVDATTAEGTSTTDLRVYNASPTPISASISFLRDDESTATRTVAASIQPGEVKVFDDVLSTTFGQTNVTGALMVTTDAPAPLVVTARTETRTASGTVGQLIEASSAADAIGRGDRALQVLQVEESDRYRSDVGVAELTGAPVQLEISATTADSKTEARMSVTLEGGQLKHFSSILQQLGLGRSYNGRVAIRVVNGSGKVLAYGTIVDRRTLDPTYVPAQ